MPKYKRGDQLKIIAVKYKSHEEGTYIRPAGFISACIKVKGDDRVERTVRLTSIALLEGKAEGRGATTPKEGQGATTKEEVLEDIAALTRNLKELELKVKAL